KELLYGMFQKKKPLKKHLDYEQMIDVLAMDKLVSKEELRAAKSKLKLYDSVMQMQNGMQTVPNNPKLLDSRNCKWLEMLDANASCKCRCKCKLQMQPANANANADANANAIYK
nr:hypothetical protein [Tanacetum cinerariifolium]